MGGRGSGSGTRMNVPYEEWGKMVDKPIKDKDGNTIGYIEDRDVYVSEPDYRTVTKKDVLNDIDGWRNDDGTYGDEDTAIYFAYKDGTFVDADDLNGKKYKTTGLVGVSISTADYEMVWGGEIGRDGKLHQWETWSEDGESGRANSYSGYKAVAVYKERVKTTYNNPNGKGGYKAVRKVIRRSKQKPLNW